MRLTDEVFLATAMVGPWIMTQLYPLWVQSKDSSRFLVVIVTDASFLYLFRGESQHTQSPGDRVLLSGICLILGIQG